MQAIRLAVLPQGERMLLRLVSAESLNLIFESFNQGQHRPYLQADTQSAEMSAAPDAMAGSYHEQQRLVLASESATPPTMSSKTTDSDV